MRRRTFLSALSAPALLAEPASSLARDYRGDAARLIGSSFTDNAGWGKLSFLCDRIGNRLAGSPSLTRAIEWSAAAMRQEGLENVVTPQVMVPHWVRGSESARLVEPLDAPLAMLGLGNSVGTPPEGITAEVCCVTSFEELEKLAPDAVRGKIVLYDVPFTDYGKTVAYRSSGASRAARMGAVAVLIRSVGPPGLDTPHTGMLSYAADAPQIPAAALSFENATRIHRIIDSGAKVRVQLKMEAHMLPDAPSANVIADIPGREKPEQIVLLGGHLDSWDVGTGAQDDGCGAIASWQAVTLVRQLGLKPRRTLRVCLFTNEENGLHGGRAYPLWAGKSVPNHVAAIEMDGGAERTIGFGLTIAGAGAEVMERAMARMRAIGSLLDGINAGEILSGGGGADIGPLTRQGVPAIAHRTVGKRYFEWHHTWADTLDKIDPIDFRTSVAALAVVGFVLADMPDRLND